jgi:23S rRNA pseudouridine955/2504/2580 synthase
VSFGVIEQLRQARPDAKFLELVHRLDKETSGILLLAKKRSALTAVQDQFRDRETGKTYLALVLGDWPAKLKVIDVPLHKYLDADGERRVRVVPADHEDGMRSITLVRVRAGPAGHAAGGDHQDRPHAPDPRAPGASRATRSPGDDKYGDFERNKAWAKQGLRRMFLHAAAGSSTTPPVASASSLHAPLPPNCETLADHAAAPASLT